VPDTLVVTPDWRRLRTSDARRTRGIYRFICGHNGKDADVTIVERFIAGWVAALGSYGVVRNRSVAEASVVSSRRYFGIHLREGSRAYRFNWIFSRTIALVVGTVMLVCGLLGVVGIDWRDIYR
jgi:hypothetical protein